jgi:3-oxoacyl-[acyl-carrier-protein] synthase-3
MTYQEIKCCAVKSIVTVVPSRIVDNLNVDNDLLAKRSRLVRNIGIRYRRLCAEGQIFSDLAAFAAEQLFAKTKWNPSEVDAIIVVTQSSEYIIPSTAIILQDRLGITTAALAYDVNLGCSGYPYGIHLGASLLCDTIRKVVVIVGDQSGSDGSEDQGREILFGDACSATALEYKPNADSLYFEGFSDGSGHKAIYIPEGGRRNPLNETSNQYKICEDGVTRKGTDVWLNGPDILNFSTRVAPESVSSILKKSSLDKADIHRFYFHQANKMINSTINKKLGLSNDLAPSSLYSYGNTSSTSVPITLCDDYSSYDCEKRKVLLCGFGIGLSWASMILNISSDIIEPIIEVPASYIS